jgi:hypothetical protein
MSGLLNRVEPGFQDKFAQGGEQEGLKLFGEMGIEGIHEPFQSVSL